MQKPVLLEWQHHETGSRFGVYSLGGDKELNALAEAHYAAAPIAEGLPEGPRRLGSYVHVRNAACEIDLMPDGSEWKFAVAGLSREGVRLGALSTATSKLLRTDPEQHPIEKGFVVASSTVKVHPNQVELLRDIEPHVVYEDDDVLALNKPPFVSTYWDRGHHIGASEMVQRWRVGDIHPVHRLDNLTSGLLLFGKSRAVRGELSAQFAERADGLRKIYVATSIGALSGDQSVLCFIDKEEKRVTVGVDPARGKKAMTTVRTLAQKDELSVSAVQIHTGRTHQIRASLAAIGSPIVGDPIYNPDYDMSSGRMMLHAHSLEFRHPTTGKLLHVKAPIPHEMLDGLSEDDASRIYDSLARI